MAEGAVLEVEESLTQMRKRIPYPSADELVRELREKCEEAGLDMCACLKQLEKGALARARTIAPISLWEYGTWVEGAKEFRWLMRELRCLSKEGGGGWRG